MTQFKWLLLICDDEVELLTDTIAECGRAGLDVVPVGKSDDFPNNVVDKLPVIQNANLALIDMQWEIGRENSDFPPVPSDSQLPAAEFCKQWMNAIQAWSTAVKKPARHEAWPRVTIQSADVGAWIGAMISWLAPQCRIVFFSLHQLIFNEKLPAALRNFRKPFFIVHPKRQADIATGVKGGIEVKELWPYFPGLQRSFLKQPSVHEWFLKSVVLRLLAGGQPKRGTASIYFPSSGDGYGGFEARGLVFENVFPNLVGLGREDQLRQLWQLIAPPRLRRNDLVALNEGEHSLKKKRNAEAQQFLYQAGLWGVGSAARLEESRIRKEKDNAADTENLIAEANDMIGWSLVDARPYLRKLASEHSGTTNLLDVPALIAGEREFSPAVSSSRNRGLVIHRFPPHWINDIIFAIRDNAKVRNCTFNFRIIEDCQSLTIEIDSEWRGELTPEIFWRSSVLDSLEKGEYRGFPQFFCSALESGADVFWLKAGGDWQRLWGVADSSEPVENGTKNLLSARLAFLKEKLN